AGPSLTLPARKEASPGKLVDEEGLRLAPQVGRLAKIHFHALHRSAGVPGPFDLGRQLCLHLRIERNLMTGRLRQALLHLGTEQIRDELPCGIGVRASAENGQRVWEVEGSEARI